MGCRRALFQPGLKIKKNFLLRWKNLRTNAKNLGKAIKCLSGFYLKEAREKKVRLFTFSIYFIIYLLILSTSIQMSFHYIDALFDSSEY